MWMIHASVDSRGLPTTSNLLLLKSVEVLLQSFKGFVGQRLLYVLLNFKYDKASPMGVPSALGGLSSGSSGFLLENRRRYSIITSAAAVNIADYLFIRY